MPSCTLPFATKSTVAILNSLRRRLETSFIIESFRIFNLSTLSRSTTIVLSRIRNSFKKRTSDTLRVYSFTVCSGVRGTSATAPNTLRRCRSFSPSSRRASSHTSSSRRVSLYTTIIDTSGRIWRREPPFSTLYSGERTKSRLKYRLSLCPCLCCRRVRYGRSVRRIERLRLTLSSSAVTLTFSFVSPVVG